MNGSFVQRSGGPRNKNKNMAPRGVSHCGKVLINYRWKKMRAAKMKGAREVSGLIRGGQARYKKIKMRNIAKVANMARQKFSASGR